MEQYVNKSDIVAEIKRIMDAENESINSFEHHRNASEKQRYNARMALLEHILSFLNNLEVKENNLVEVLDYNDYTTFFKEHPEYINGGWGFEETWTFGQYCYTLGLNAQKAEEIE